MAQSKVGAVAHSGIGGNRDAINKLTPPSESNTTKYLADLQQAGVDLDKTVKSQIDVLMPAVQANEGLIAGIVVPRTP